MIEKIKERIIILEEVIKDSRDSLISETNVIHFNRWVGELRAYKSILKIMEENKHD